MQNITHQNRLILSEITKFNKGSESISLTTIFSVCLRQRLSVTNASEPGLGKSRSTVELLDLLRLPKTTVLSGKVSPYEFFKLLAENHDGLIVIDEFQQDRSLLTLLKAAISQQYVEWTTRTKEGEEIPPVPFRGSIIMNLNSLALNQDMVAVLDRTLINQASLSDADFLYKMENFDSYKPDKVIWQMIRDRIQSIRSHGLQPLTEPEVRQAKNLVLSAYRHGKLGRSLRSIKTALLVYRHAKTFFRSFTPEIKAVADKIVSDCLRPLELDNHVSQQKAQLDDLVVDLKKRKAGECLPFISLYEIIMQRFKLKRSRAAELVKQLLEDGQLVRVNRGLVRVP